MILVSMVQTFKKMIRTIPANLSCTVIVDACFSAGLFEGAAKEQIGPNSTSHIVNHTIHPNAVMIASCCNKQSSIGERFNGFGYHPLFPRFIKRKRGTLFVESLLKAVKRRKRRVTHQGKKRKCRVTNKRLVRRIARLLEKILEKDGETQQPALFCSDTQARLDFLGPIA